MKCPVKLKRLSTNLAKFAQILGILNNNFKPTLVQKFSRIRVYNALDLPTNLYGSEIWTLEKFGPLEKRIKKRHQPRLYFSEQPGTHFLITKGK